jgi:threonine dehydrogenase-like Zn-dependent dehydrogenase
MRAAVTEGRRAMRVVEVPDPGEPGPGEVLVRPEAVGLCGSDFHYFLGDIADALGVELYPRVQGHEAAGTLEAVGPDCPPQLRPGQRVALWPLVACGRCYACRVGRDNVCANINLIGIHRDGMLQDLLRVPASQVFPVGTEDPALAALIEPVSIAVRAVGRGRVEPGEKAVVFGAGPIGQAVAIAVTDRGGTALLVDRVRSRVERGKVTGAELLTLEDGVDVVAATREWAGDDGPQLVFEATGVPEVARTAVEVVSRAGRVVIVGLSGQDAPFRVGDLAFKEIDLLGVSCCNAGEFVDAVDLVGRRADALAGLVTHQFALEETPGAIAYAMEHPAEVMKAVIRLEDSA